MSMIVNAPLCILGYRLYICSHLWMAEMAWLPFVGRTGAEEDASRAHTCQEDEEA
jgi:hypothetical protein